VLWAFYEGNDLEDIWRYEEATRDWERFSKRLHSFRSRSFTTNAHLALRRVMQKALGIRSPVPKRYRDIQGGTFETRGGPIRITFFYEGHPLTEYDERALDKVAATLRRAFDLCVSAHARLVVVFVPTTFRVYGPFTRFEVGSRALGWPQNDLPQRLQALVRERLPGAAFLDLTPAFGRVARRGSLAYFPNDAHWTPEGHRVAASAMAELVRDWLEER
jgi:hypothetical protein